MTQMEVNVSAPKDGFRNYSYMIVKVIIAFSNITTALL